MKMKRITKSKSFVLMLALILVMGILSGCGDTADSTDSENSDSIADSDEDALSDENTDDSDAAGSSSSDITFDSLEVVNNDECAITITGIDPDDLWGYALEVTLENKSADKTYMFAVDYGCINGVYCDPFYADM